IANISRGRGLPVGVRRSAHAGLSIRDPLPVPAVRLRDLQPDPLIMKEITIDRPEWHEVCVVCAKPTSGSRGFAQLNFGEAEIFLCCPGCVAAFDAERDRYFARREMLKPSDLGGMH
ncbi:MAG: hypothetical protein WA771_01280, partial [Chthoniobacterales bacterium]